MRLDAIVRSELPRLSTVLETYARLSGKSLQAVRDHEARQWTFALYDHCKRLAPAPPTRIAKEAAERGFRMGRRSNAFTTSRSGISVAAWKRADDLLEGEKSDLFKIVGAGAVQPKRVRFSVRGRHAVLRGGRFGNKFAASALRASALSKDERAFSLSRYPLGVKRLNRRALATAVEIAYRTRAAGGGFMASQWLHKVWQKRKSATMKGGPLIARSRDGRMTGRVDLVDRKGTTGASLRGFVPGTAKQLRRWGIVRKIEAERIADRLEYIRNKQAEAALRAGMKPARPVKPNA